MSANYINLYMLFNAKVSQNGISDLECEYTAKSNALNLCLNNIIGILLVSNTVELPNREAYYIKNSIKYIVPIYDTNEAIQDEWLHFLWHEPFNECFSIAKSRKVCLCAVKECEVNKAFFKAIEVAFPQKMAILDATSIQTENLFLRNCWTIAKACI